VTAQFVQLTGPMAFGPRWSLGLALTAMALADAKDAGDRILGFLRDCGTWSVPCSAFHFGSGYTSIAGKRYVFHWNRWALLPTLPLQA
jgi:alpha-glucosidase